MRKAPLALDLSLLDFLEHGDQQRILQEEKKDGYKTTQPYISKVLNGDHRNDRILRRALNLALKRKGQFPLQAITITQ